MFYQLEIAQKNFTENGPIEKKKKNKKKINRFAKGRKKKSMEELGVYVPFNMISVEG